MWIRELDEQMSIVSPCSSASWSSLLAVFHAVGQSSGLLSAALRARDKAKSTLQLLLLWPAALFFHLMHAAAITLLLLEQVLWKQCAGTGSSPLWAGPSSKLECSTSQGAWRRWSDYNYRDKLVGCYSFLSPTWFSLQLCSTGCTWTEGKWMKSMQLPPTRLV